MTIGIGRTKVFVLNKHLQQWSADDEYKCFLRADSTQLYILCLVSKFKIPCIL